MHGSFQVGDYFVEPRFNRVTKGAHTAQLAPKYMHVLVCLADAAGDLVTRGDLMETVWPDTIVGDESLTRAISELRQVFHDDAQTPTYIETIRGRGYRLLLPVTYAAPPLGAAVPTALPPRRTTWRWSGGVLVLVSVILGPMLWKQAGIGQAPSFFPTVYQARPLTSDPGQEVDPALSPDGRQVAFVRRADNADLYVQTLGEATRIRLTETDADEHKPAWSPDGRTLAFIRTGAGCEVLLVPAHGGSPEQLARCTPDTVPSLSWSPDGQTLVWARRPADGGPRHLMAFDRATRTSTRLTTPPASSSGDGYPAFSPDGQTLAFVRTQAFGIQDVYLYDRAAGTTTRWTTDETKIGGLTWTPGGEGLLFSSKRNGYFSLWHLPRTGGPPQWANATYHNIHHPSMAQQGARRVYERWTVDTNIWRLPLTGPPGGARTPAQPWITSTLWDGHPALSPDGQQLAFASDRSGSPEIWIAQHDGTHPRKLTSFGGPFTGSPQWAADGKTLVFESRAQGNADLYLLHLETGVQERLTTDPANDVAPRWSRDGTAVYFGSNRQAGWQLWKKSLTTGTLQQVTVDGGYVGMEAPDGQSLYYVKHDAPGLWKQPRADGAPRLRDCQIFCVNDQVSIDVAYGRGT